MSHPRAMAFLVVAVLSGATLAGAGCGGDDGSERAVEWSVERIVGPKSARLVATVEVCWYPVRLEEPTIEYEDDRAYLELRHTPEKNEDELDGCLPSLSIFRPKVSFERSLDELTLFDSSTDPPEQRWPRKSPWPGE